MKYSLSTSAEEDLIQIYIADAHDFGFEQAQRYHQKLQHTFEFLADNPFAGTLGLRHAKGEFVMCHDGDDWSHPERIARQMQPLLDDDALVATTSQWVRLTDDGQFVARQVYPLMRFNPSSPLFRRKVVEEKTGLWDCVRTGADSEFHARLKLVFGRKAVKRINLPLSVGAQRNDSLVGSVETGFGGDGFSPERLAYWEAWNYWHIAELRAGRTPCMPLIDSPERSFAVPASLRVDPAAIRAELSSETNGSDTGSGIARPE